MTFRAVFGILLVGLTITKHVNVKPMTQL